MLRQLETAQPSMLTWRIYDPKGWIPDWFYHATTSPLYFPPLEGEPKFLSQNHSSRSHPGWAGFAHQFQLICDLKFTIQSKWCTVAPCEWFCHSKMELFPHPYSCTSLSGLRQGAGEQVPSVLRSHTWADLILLRNGTKTCKLYSFVALWDYFYL